MSEVLCFQTFVLGFIFYLIFYKSALLLELWKQNNHNKSLSTCWKYKFLHKCPFCHFVNWLKPVLQCHFIILRWNWLVVAAQMVLISVAGSEELKHFILCRSCQMILYMHLLSTVVPSDLALCHIQASSLIKPGQHLYSH